MTLLPPPYNFGAMNTLNTAFHIAHLISIYKDDERAFNKASDRISALRHMQDHMFPNHRKEYATTIETMVAELEDILDHHEDAMNAIQRNIHEVFLNVSERLSEPEPEDEPQTLGERAGLNELKKQLEEAEKEHAVRYQDNPDAFTSENGFFMAEREDRAAREEG